MSLRYPDDQILAAFFTNTLAIDNWKWSHITRDLLIRSTGANNVKVDEAGEVYEFLNSNVRDDSDWQSIR
jgi:hypothetical protein